MYFLPLKYEICCNNKKMEKVWFKDPRRFITEKNYDKFYPSSTMTYAEKLNSVMRLSLYFTLVVFILKKDSNILFIPIFTGIFTFFLYSNTSTKKNNEETFLSKMNLYKDPFTNEVCHRPSAENPFMNILISDYKTNPKRVKACNINKGNIKKEAQQYFNQNLYRDVGDIFHKNASDRNWYTTASTTIPNDDQSFKDYLYSLRPTCKEGSGNACYGMTFRPNMK
jgi:hypothetical protein